MLVRGLIVVFFAGFFLLQGCVAVQSFPTAARAGETVTLAVGSLEGATETNLTATFTPNATPGIQVNLPIRSVFNIYPEKTSDANLSDVTAINNSRYLTVWSGHAVWLTVVVVDLPGDLPVGSGKIDIVLGQGVSPVINSKLISDVAIGIDVLPPVSPGDTPVGGDIPSAAPGLFQYYSDTYSSLQNGDLNRLKPVKQVLIRAVNTGGFYGSGLKVAAAEFKFNVQLSSVDSPNVNPDSGVMVIREENIYDYGQSIDWRGNAQTLAAQTQMSYSKQGNILTVNFISVTGELQERLIRFSIVPYTATGFDFAAAPNLISIKYFDLNGNELISNDVPELVNINF